MRKFLLFLFIAQLSASAIWGQQESGQKRDYLQKLQALGQRAKDYFNEPFDTTRDEGYWMRALKHGKLDIQDTTVNYPGFLDFCAKAYRWGDYAFNHYDSAYVVGTGKKWKLMIYNNNWIDSYNGDLGKTPVLMVSDFTANFGAQISFMAISLGYMLNMRNVLSNKKVRNTRWRFDFTTSRVAIDAYYTKNDESGVHIQRLGRFKGDYKFGGLERKSQGIYMYYFLNHLHYAQAAAYSFSKYQKRSSGSFILGFHYGLQNISLDFDHLSDDMLSYLPDALTKYRFNYRDYCVIAGYGYNWVVAKNWLVNFTGMPSIGYRRSSASSIEGKKDLFSINIRGKFAFIHNHGKFFYGLHAINDGHLYNSKKYSFYNNFTEINITAGYRF